MLINPPPKFRRRRDRKKRSQGSPVVAPLTLVAASYDPDFGPTLRLTFDRAIAIAALDGQQIVVDDNGNLGLKFEATGAATLETPTRVAIVLAEIDSATGTGITLDASAESGIVASDDGGAWAGVEDLELPFP